MTQTLTHDEKQSVAALWNSHMRVRKEWDLQRAIVAELRETGIPWSIIAAALSITKQGAQQRFSA